MNDTDFNKVVNVWKQGNEFEAVDGFYKILINDDNAIYNIPAGLLTIDFCRALANSYFDYFSATLKMSYRSRVFLIHNYLLMTPWLDYENDNQVLPVLNELQEWILNDQTLMMCYAMYYKNCGLWRTAMLYVHRIQNSFVQSAMTQDLCLLKVQLCRALGADQELEVFLESLTEDQYSADIFCLEAAWRRERGEYEKGVAAAQRALEFTPGIVDGLFELGTNMFLMDSDNLEAALRTWGIIIEYARAKDPGALYYMCFIDIYLKDKESAVRHLGELMNTGDPESMLDYAAAEVFAALGNFEMSTDLLEKLYKKGFHIGRNLLSDQAFSAFKETKEGAAVIEKLIRRLEHLDYMASEKVLESLFEEEITITAHSEPNRIGYFADKCFKMDEYVLPMAAISTSSPSTIVCNWCAVHAGLVDPESSQELSFQSAFRKEACLNVFNPFLYFNQKGYHAQINPSQICGEGEVALRQHAIVTAALSWPVGAVVGLDNLSSIAGFKLLNTSSDSVGDSEIVSFKYNEGFLSIPISVLSALSWESDEVALDFIVDSNCAVSYISMQTYQDFSEDEYAFPLEKTLLPNGNQVDCIHCSLKIGSYTLDDVTLVVFDEPVRNSLGFDILSRFQQIEIDNIRRKICFTTM